MTDFQPITALRLPLLVLEETLGFMDIVDWFALSKVSKRSQRVVKCIQRKLKYEVTLVFKGGMLLINLSRSNKTITIGTFDLENSEIDQIKDGIAHLTDTLAVDNISFNFFGTNRDPMLDIAAFVTKLGVPLGSVKTGRYCMADKLCKFILEECSMAKSLDVSILTTYWFALPPTRLGSFQCDRFILRHASWFTMNHVTSWLMNCKEIKLLDLPFTDQDVNRFLKLWIEGSSVEHLELTNLNGAMYSLDEVLNGIPRIPARAAKMKSSLYAKNGFIIEQKGGLKVFVYRWLNYCFNMTTEYELT